MDRSSQEFFGATNFFDRTFFGPKFFWHNFWTHFFGPKLVDQTFILTTNIFYQILFWTQSFLDPKVLEFFWAHNLFGQIRLQMLKILIYKPKCTWEWSLTLALAQLVCYTLHTTDCLLHIAPIACLLCTAHLLKSLLYTAHYILFAIQFTFWTVCLTLH